MAPALTYFLWFAPTWLLLVWLGRPRTNPLRISLQAAGICTTSAPGRWAAFLAALLLALDLAQARVDPAVTAALGWDFTELVYSLEGDAVAHLQATTPPLLLPLLAWVYAPGFPSLLGAPLVHWAAERRWRAFYAQLGGLFLNYLLALPFYFLVPVREVGWSGLGSAQPWIEEVWPGMTAFLRSGSALDNCFPSLHVSCAVTTLCQALRYGSRAWRRVAWVGAALTAWSTLALGIHWVLDVIAGVPFGIGCAFLAERLVRRVKPVEAG